ncbi:phage portal protein, SPP1 Gp6-like [Anaerotignum neopropionicum]|uniref:Phage portal protein, SPP1 Gp6-like n=2 Tax=Anaerotignum neopropionicum TaxID=36847 RepID=A0A136WBU7_9FIRM|nr:phage portal protein, SPP1 Gp6-like [Anaerotignum neopropionicum]
MRLFGITKTDTTDKDITKNAEYSKQFENTEQINFTAIFAAKMTTLSVSESTADIVGDNARVALLDECMSDAWKKIKRITSRMLGTGGCVAVPYVQDGEIHVDILEQSRIIIHSKKGNRITAATVLADSVTQGTRKYYRWTDYRVENDVVYISNRVTDESGKDAFIEQWAGIEDRAITGVDRVLFAYFKSPVDNRKFGDFYGVPITYGCESLINEIYECFGQIRDEYSLKEVRVFADERMFKKDEKTGKYKMPSKLFFAAHNETGSMIETFSPDIRTSSYYDRLMYLFELLERSVGTSKGILTAPETRGATATEIKAGLYDTYAMIADIRTVIENGMNDYIYACNVLANYYGLTPMGGYETAYDWSYSLIESSSETWGQLKDAQSMGLKSKAELRQWLNPNETADEAQAMIDEIKKSEPTLGELIGG